MKRVLILCTGNSCRSQIAEAFWNALGDGEWEAHSAGSRPAGYVHPLAVQVMGEAGVDLSRHESKSLESYLNEAFDLVVTVCGHAQQACPTFPSAIEMLHWPFEDPAHAEGSEEAKLRVFREIRDQIRDRIARYLADHQ